MSPLQTFLNSHVATSNDVVSNAGLPPMKGRWSIPKEEYEEFLTTYATAIELGQELHMTELHEGIGPIVIDIDFRFGIDTGLQRMYSEDDVAALVQLYYDQIVHYFKVDDADERLTAYVFEKPSPVRQDGYIKDGIHIMYPGILSKPDVQYDIRENVIQMCKTRKLLDHLNLKKDLEDVFDEAVIKRSGWMMYGSSKAESAAYKLSKVYNSKNEETVIPELSTTELVKLFSIRNRSQTEITELKIEPSRRRNTAIAPQSLHTQVLQPMSEVEQGNMELSKQLVQLLSNTRADTRDAWIDVGIALFNVSRSLLSTWKDFSKLSTKYKEGECERQWRSFENYRGQRLTIASLHLWAKIDNPQRYVDLKRNEATDLLHRSLDCTHYDVAALMHLKYQFQFVCSNLKFNTWYEFKGHRWMELQKASELRKKLSTEIAYEYSRLSAQLVSKSAQNSEDTTLKEKIKMCNKLLKSVKDHRFKENVVKECEDLFDDFKFERKLDANVNLIGFNNGVYDLNAMFFRDGRPDDYVSYSTGYDYQPLDCDDPDTIEMGEFLKQVLPDPHVRKYVLKLIASFLSGKTGEQKFHIWTGSGSNGKSKLLDLIEYAFGDYSKKLPVTVLTHKRVGSSSANPEIAQCKGKRFVSFQEPEKDDKIHVGYMKELTGGDTIMAREMYKSPVEFKPQFKMVLACNDLPAIPSTDGGTWRRLRVVDFPSKFVDNPEKDNEFKRDVNIPEKLIAWKECFMSLLVSFHEKYKKEGLQEPECVMKYTREYQRKSDSFMDFVEEHIEVTNDDNDILYIQDVHLRYKSWYYEAYNHNPPSRINFRDDMERKFGEYHKRFGWRGIRMKEELCDSDNDI